MVDCDDPSRNDFLVANQFLIECGNHRRRADLVVFVNGLPIAAIELKDPTTEQADLGRAYGDLQEAAT